MKKFRFIAISLLLVLLSFVMVSCSNVDQSIEYSDTISSRYADSFEILSTSSAPTNASECVKEERVEKKILLDTRILGSHLLGLYAPKQEEIEITIPLSEVANNNAILVNPNLPGEQKILLDEAVKKFTLTEGGILEFEYNGKNNESNCITIKVKGAIEASYYRYGIDNENLKNVGNYLTLDSVNIRMYAPIDKLSSIKDVQKVMLWWQNAINFMDKAYNLSFYKNDFSPMKIYFTKDSYSFDELNNIVYMPIVDSETAFNNNLLVLTNEAKLYNILFNIATLKTRASQLATTSEAQVVLAEIISSLTYAKFVDCFSASDVSENYILSEYDCMQLAIDNSFIDDKQKNIALIMILYYELGDSAILESIKENFAEYESIQDFVYAISNKAKVNTIPLLELFNLKESLNVEKLTQLEEYEKIALVANKYAYGRANCDIQTGLHFKYGQVETIDFNEGLIGVGNWKIDSVEGKYWKKVSDGVYSYNPTYSTLKDVFYINLSQEGKTKTLIGNLVVDIDVAYYSLYSNIKYDALSNQDKLNDAIKKASSISPNEKKSVYSASIEKEEVVDTNSYSLAKLTGCMQVTLDNKYTFYLKSSGLCKVIFGVEDHNFTMFENSLTVGEYTEELKYEISLKKGYKYYYTIYVLSNKGSGYANIGIKAEGNNKIEYMDRAYLIADEKKLNRSNIVSFSPEKTITPLNEQEVVDNKIEIKQIREKSQDLEVIQTNSLIKITANNMQEETRLILPLITSSKIDYLKIKVNNMQDVNIKLTSGSDFSNVLLEKKLTNGDNYFVIENAKYLSEVKVSFNKDVAYDIDVLDLEVGQKISKMQIVPSSSTSIEYIGEWSTSHKYIGINNSVNISSSSLSSVSYQFNGDEISIYAVKDKNFGSATIIIDGQEKASIDLYSESVSCSQLVYTTKLQKGDHTIEIKANGDAPISLDYFAVSMLGETQIKNDFSKLWYVVFIPLLILIAGIVCISLDIKEKKKHKN